MKQFVNVDTLVRRIQLHGGRRLKFFLLSSTKRFVSTSSTNLRPISTTATTMTMTTNKIMNMSRPCLKKKFSSSSAVVDPPPPNSTGAAATAAAIPIHTKGYVAMGSFHSENVDTLMSLDDDEYQQPQLPFDDDDGSYSHTGNNNNNNKDFLLDLDTWTFINHGAFGGGVRVGVERARQWRYYLERQPLRYFDRDLLPHLVYSARRLASFCNVPPSSRSGFTLLPNVTYGLNTVLKGYVNSTLSSSSSSPKQPHVILWDTSYGSLKKMAREYVSLHKGGKVTEIPVSQYFDRFTWNNDSSKDSTRKNNDVFMDALMDTIRELESKGGMNDSTDEKCLFILDHTTSNTALNMPIKQLSKYGHEKGWIVMVDGAHGLLAQDLNFSKQQQEEEEEQIEGGEDAAESASGNNEMQHVDIYVGNCHKWFSSPRGVGFMYCPDSSMRDTILCHPAVMSHGVGEGFQSMYLWDGCRDYAGALSIPAVIDFWDKQGTKNEIRKRIVEGRNKAISILGNAWHNSTTTERVTLAPLDVHSPMMALVLLPDCVQPQEDEIATSEEAKAIQDFLFDHYVEVPIKVVGGLYYVR